MEEVAQLICVPGPKLTRGEGSTLWSMSELGWVANDGTSPFGITERPPDHDMDLVNGLDVQTAAAIAPASFKQGRVEAIEVLGVQVSKWHTTQMG